MFGCEAYAHFKQDKLELRALRCIFLAHPEGVKGYKLWYVEPRNQRCIVSRDVIFNERVMGYKSNEQLQDLDGDISQNVTEVEVESQATNPSHENSQERGSGEG